MNRPHGTCPRCLVRHTPVCKAPRWPLAPLLAALGDKSAAKTLRASGEEIERARREGIADVTADRWALRIGQHPASIWPDWFDAALTETDRQYLENGWRQAWEWNNRNDASECAA